VSYFGLEVAIPDTKGCAVEPEQAPPFGELLRRSREAASLTQAALARRAGLDTSYISRLERSDGTTPHTETLSRLVYALGLSGPSRDEFLAAARGRAHAPIAAVQRSPVSSIRSAEHPTPAAPSQLHAAVDEPRQPPACLSEVEDDAETRRVRLEMRVREIQEALRSADSQVEALTEQLGQVTQALQSSLARQRYQTHELQEVLAELGRIPFTPQGRW
jgi:transcriptional regulator with XRE-family HTH domain